MDTLSYLKNLRAKLDKGLEVTPNTIKALTNALISVVERLDKKASDAKEVITFGGSFSGEKRLHTGNVVYINGRYYDESITRDATEYRKRMYELAKKNEIPLHDDGSFYTFAELKNFDVPKGCEIVEDKQYPDLAMLKGESEDTKIVAFKKTEVKPITYEQVKKEQSKAISKNSNTANNDYKIILDDGEQEKKSPSISTTAENTKEEKKMESTEKSEESEAVPASPASPAPEAEQADASKKKENVKKKSDELNEKAKEIEIKEKIDGEGNRNTKSGTRAGGSSDKIFTLKIDGQYLSDDGEGRLTTTDEYSSSCDWTIENADDEHIYLKNGDLYLTYDSHEDAFVLGSEAAPFLLYNCIY